MTPTEKGRRRDALLYGFDTRLQLCDMIANREADLEDARESVKRLMTQRDERLARAEAANAKLRDERSEYQATIDSLVDECADHKAENEKLRELAERAWKSAERLCQAFDGPCRDDGVAIAKPCPMGERDEECVYGQLQRELRECGVEVDA